MIIIEGRLQMHSWTDRDGGRHEKAEILAENVYFGDSRKKED
jgi:single-strand DNA-binding protein